MAALEAVKTGNWTAKATWKVVGKEETKVPTTADDCLIPSSFTVTVAAGSVARSLEMTGTGALAGTEQLELGALTVNVGGFIWKIAGTCTISWTGKLRLASASAAALTVTTGGKTINNLEAIAGSYKQEDTLNVTATYSPTGNLTWDNNGHEVVAGGAISYGNNVHLKASGATIRSTGAGISFSGVKEAETIIEDNAATVYSIAAGATFALGKRKLAGKLEAPENATVGPGEVGALAINSKGAAAGKGVKVEKATKLVAGTVTTSGTEGSPARLESTEGGAGA